MSQDNDDERQRRIARLVDSLVRVHGSQLEWRVMRIVHDRDTARVIVQDTYEQLVRRLRSGSTTPLLHPAAWVYKAARTNALLYWHRQRSGPELVADDELAHGVADPAPGPEKLVALHETMNRLGDIINKLPPRQRRVFLLAVDGVLAEDIAKQLGMSVSAVRRQLTRANARCQKRLKQLHIDSEFGIADGPDSH